MESTCVFVEDGFGTKEAVLPGSASTEVVDRDGDVGKRRELRHCDLHIEAFATTYRAWLDMSTKGASESG